MVRRLRRPIGKRVIDVVPNGLSMLNLIFGFLSIVSTIEGDFIKGALFIILAAVADGFDGKIARKVDAVSDMGAEFDSLSDLVSFGVASAVLLYVYALQTMEYGVFIAILMVVCAALRLARFNVESSPDYFEGVPTPAFGFFAAGWVISGLVLPVEIAAGLFVFVALAMVTIIKYPTFKKASQRTWAYLVMAGVVLIVLVAVDKRFAVLPYFVYALGGPFAYKFSKK
jgi:CDP-diacylglycerol--serine O-phosphatidyltransferase